MKKKFIALLFACTFCHARDSRPIILVTIHKCGTHLLGEAVAEFTGKKIFWPGYIRGKNLDESLEEMREDRFMMIHIPYSGEAVETMQRHNPILFFLYRDPRDYAVSFAHFRNNWQALDGKPDLAKTITNLIDTFVAPWYADSTSLTGAAGLFDAMMGWCQYPGVCVIRFEDLIGPRGGGSAIKQRETVERIAQHLGVPYNEARIDEVSNNIFGNGVTFREGKIGSWKTHFSSADIELFKINAGQLLIDLGYENDLNWDSGIAD